MPKTSFRPCEVKRIIKRNSYNPRPGRMEVNKNAGWRANSCEIHPKTTKKPAISDWFLELMTGFEPVTSSLPTMNKNAKNGVPSKNHVFHIFAYISVFSLYHNSNHAITKPYRYAKYTIISNNYSCKVSDQIYLVSIINNPQRIISIFEGTFSFTFTLAW